MNDPLDIFRTRVEISRFTGEMPQYAEDVSELLEIIDHMEMAAMAYQHRINKANVRVSQLRLQAEMTDTSESSKHDRQLLYRGASEIVDVFNEVTR